MGNEGEAPRMPQHPGGRPRPSLDVVCTVKILHSKLTEQRWRTRPWCCLHGCS